MTTPATAPCPLRAEQFPKLLSAAATPQRHDRLVSAIADITQGLEKGSIPNPNYVAAKEQINRAIDAGWEQHVSVPFRGRDEQLSEAEMSIAYSSLSCARDVTVMARKLSRVQDNTPFLLAARQFVQETLPLADAVAELKAKAVKRQPRSEEERASMERYQPPPGSEASAKLITDVLQAITERHYQALLDGLQQHYEGQLARFVREEAQRDLRSTRAPTLFYPITRLVRTRQEGPLWRYVAELDASVKVLRLATSDAQSIRDAFIHKNLKKLHAIVDGKGNPLSIEVVREFLRMSGLEGTLRVCFDDGSSFLARNSVVLSHSVHGTPFLRYPLTFHDVVLADGSRMGRPSEERMNTIFLAGDTNEQPAQPVAPRPRMRG